MASATESRPPVPPPPPASPAEGQLVNAQIQRTRRALKMVDLSTGIITLIIGVLAYVLVLAVLEHWIIPGGWSGGARIVLFAGLLFGILGYSWRVFWPLIRNPINPAYAAQTIEQSSPSLKNSLLNLLLLRNRRRQLSNQVYQAIERQAAQRLSEIPRDTTVDHSAVLRLGYILVAVVALCALYRVLSPKDFMASAARVLLPWSDVAVPSRVKILNTIPGDTSAARGDQVTVAAEITGLDEDEQVRVLFSTADQQIVGQQIFMSADEGGLRFECRMPGGVAQRDGGLQQNLTYWIEAGDARSPRYELTVFSRPTLVVQKIQYDYPDYTGYPDREEAHTGDLHAIEGTVVTLSAIANQPISSAHVDFEADGRLNNLMKAEDQQATVSFPLELRDDRRTPRHQSYVLRYTTEDGRKNELPPKYEIEVTPDYAPEIQLRFPEEEVIDVAVDEQVTIEVEAHDPDFAVRDVVLLGEVEGQQVLREILLKKNHTGRFVKQYRFTPEDLELKVGSILEYWATAADNRRPIANKATTKRRKIRVVDSGKEGEEQGENQPGENGGEDEPSEEDSQPGEDGEEGSEGEGQSSDSGQQQSEQGEGTEGEAGESGEGGAGQDAEGMEGEGEDQQQGQGGGQSQGSEGQEDSDANSEGGAGGESSDNQDDNSSEENASDQPGGSQSGEGGGNQEKVSPEGDEDGKAFDRIAEHFEEQEGESDQEGQEGQEGEATEQEQGEGESSGDGQSKQKGGDTTDGKPDPDQSGEANEEEAEQGETQGADGQQKDSQGEGAAGEQAPEQDGPGEQEGEQSEADDSAEGQMSKEQGDPGEGENPGENEGTTAADEGKKPDEKEGEQPAGEKQNDQEAPAEGQGQSESDTEGSQGGDRSGEGQEGAGQQADAEGKGGAGEHQAADEGAGKSEESGDGETSSKPGDDQQAEGETGESSKNKPGEGSEQAEGGKESDQEGGQQGEQSANPQGESEGKEPTGDQPTGEQPGEGNSDSGQQPTDQQSNTDQQPSQSPDPQSAGEGSGNNSSPPPAGETLPGDEANLDYAKKQTDLILDKLEDQVKKKEVDEGLLEKLGWSQEELRRFVDRWKGLKTEAEGNGANAEEAQQELDDALRSLGLGKDRRTGFQSKTAKDMFRDLQDAPRVRTPLEYQDRLRGYIKGTATGDVEE